MILVLLSGGLDSTVCMWLARKRGPVVVLNVDYGQRAAQTERRMSAALAGRIGASYRYLDLTPLGSTLTSALTGDGDDVVVPGRNAILLSLGAGLARSVGASEVWIGCNASDSALFPDCRPEFLGGMSQALHTAYGVTVEAPLLYLTKAQVVGMARVLGVPMHAITTCYNGTNCGKCHACQVLAQAL